MCSLIASGSSLLLIGIISRRDLRKLLSVKLEVAGADEAAPIPRRRCKRPIP